MHSFSQIVIFLKDTPICFIAVLDRMIYMLFFRGVVCNEDDPCICQKIDKKMGKALNYNKVNIFLLKNNLYIFILFSQKVLTENTK